MSPQLQAPFSVGAPVLLPPPYGTGPVLLPLTAVTTAANAAQLHGTHAVGARRANGHGGGIGRCSCRILAPPRLLLLRLLRAAFAPL